MLHDEGKANKTVFKAPTQVDETREAFFRTTTDNYRENELKKTNHGDRLAKVAQKKEAARKEFEKANHGNRLVKVDQMEEEAARMEFEMTNHGDRVAKVDQMEKEAASAQGSPTQPQTFKTTLKEALSDLPIHCLK
eukprot:gene6520-3160_t